MRPTAAVVALAIVDVAFACNRASTPETTSTPVAPAPNSGTRLNVAQIVARLSDSRQAVRDQAAAELRAASAAGPAAIGDRGMEFWKKRLAAIPLGITQAEFAKRMGAISEGSGSSGGGTSVIFRLDDYWVVNAFFTDEPAPGASSPRMPEKLTGLAPVERSVRHVWVEPGKDFTGRWVTYFADGVMASDLDYLRGAQQPSRR